MIAHQEDDGQEDSAIRAEDPLDGQQPDPGRPPPGEGSSPPSDADSDDPLFVLRAQLGYVLGSDVSVGGRDVTHIDTINITTITQQAVDAVEEIRQARCIPPPPSPDAPLQDQVDHWFQYDLTDPREKFFIVALSMFYGLKYPDFKDIYEVFLHVMEVEDEDSRRQYFQATDEDLVEKSHAIIERTDDRLEEIIRFEDEHYPVAIQRLLRRRFRDVLLDLLPALKEIGERHRYWEIRARVAQAVAEIGKLGFYRMRSQVLEPWARDHRAYVRATVGYTLARLAEDEDYRLGVEELLNEWAQPERLRSLEGWRYGWTAASTYKQIGAIEADWALRGLRDLAGLNSLRIMDAVIHTLIVLSLEGKLSQVLLTIKGWIDAGDTGTENDTTPQIRCVVGILAFAALSQVHIEVIEERFQDSAHDIDLRSENLFELVCKGEATHGEYWELVVSMGLRSFECSIAGMFDMAEVFYDLMVRWIEYAANNPQLQNSVRNLLTETFIRASPKYRHRMYNRLGRWERQRKSAVLAEMATSTKNKIKDRVLDEPYESLGDIKFGGDDHIVFG